MGSMSLFERLMEGAVVIGAGDARIVSANKAAAEMLGYDHLSEMINADLLKHFLPEDRERAAVFLGGLLDDGGPGESMDSAAVTRDGRRLWIRAAGLATAHEGHRARLVLLQDVTAGKALDASEERFRALIENASDAVAVVDAEGRIVYESPSRPAPGEEALGGLFGSRLLEVIHPDDVQTVIGLFERLKSDPGAAVSEEVRVKRKDGSWGRAEGVGRNLLNDPRINGIVINYRDISEKRRAEDALRESERLYRLLAENLSDVVWVVDLKLEFTYVSPSVERLLGYTVAEATAMPTGQIVVPESFEKAMQVMAEEQERERSGQSDRERSVTLDLELPHRDGSTVWTETRVSYLRDAAGEVTGFLGVSRDISGRKKAQDALKISEARFRTIFEESPIGAIVFDGAGVPVAANEACARIFGVSSVAELEGPSLFDDPLLSDPAKEQLRHGRVVNAEMEIDLDDPRVRGGHRYGRSGLMSINLSLSPLGLHPGGLPGGYLALVEDVTERRKASEALRTSEERFRGLVETTSDWVWEVDRGGAYTYVSPKVSNVLGYDAGEMEGKKPFDFMPPAEARRGAAAFNASVWKQEPFAFVENVMRHKDGHPLVMETSGVPFLGPDGELAGYRGVGRDITERKATARRLEQSVRKLERTMEAVIQAISTTMETRDPYTAGHQKRVTQLAGLLAKEMGLPPSQVAGIRVAGLLHDIGKISIPTEILSKPGRLTATEMAMIRFHPSVGYDILKSIEFEWPVADIILQHHERLNGSGYPAGLRGEKILVEARILAVADVVEAMSSHRPYRPAVGRDKALEEIVSHEGQLYDPAVVKACLATFNEKGFAFE